MRFKLNIFRTLDSLRRSQRATAYSHRFSPNSVFNRRRGAAPS